MASPKTYHREDLRGELLRAGRVYIAENGHHSLSVRTLAQAVGVSPGAPYHHFRDRRSFLLALALDGQEELTESAASAAATAEKPRDQLIALAMNFVNFACANPRLLELMYESELTSPTIDPALMVYQKKGQKVLMQPLHAALPELPDEELEVRVLALWSTIYGLSSLEMKHMVDEFEPPRVSREAVIRKVMSLAVNAALLDEPAAL